MPDGDTVSRYIFQRMFQCVPPPPGYRVGRLKINCLVLFTAIKLACLKLFIIIHRNKASFRQHIAVTQLFRGARAPK